MARAAPSLKLRSSRSCDLPKPCTRVCATCAVNSHRPLVKHDRTRFSALNRPALIVSADERCVVLIVI